MKMEIKNKKTKKKKKKKTSIQASISLWLLSARRRNAIKMAFCWWVDGGPLIDVAGICPDIQVFFCTQMCDSFFIH